LTFGPTLLTIADKAIYLPPAFADAAHSVCLLHFPGGETSVAPVLAHHLDTESSPDGASQRAGRTRKGPGDNRGES
jgi:hypothetical protein